jgi:hypothetical protein
MKNRKANLGCTAPSIRCNDCKMEFVLMVVYRSTEPYQEDDHHVAHQIGCFFLSILW